ERSVVWAFVTAAGSPTTIFGLAGFAATGVITRGAPNIAVATGVLAGVRTGAPGARRSISATTSRMVWGRWSADLASILAHSSSTAGSMVASIDLARGGTMERCAEMSWPNPGSVKGGRPHSISNRMQPSE